MRRKLEKKVEAKRAAEDGHPDDPTVPQTLDQAIVKDPVKFCQIYLKFNPTPYQEKLLKDESKRIYVCWSRQSGKSTTLAARMIQRCLQFPGTLRLIVAPGLRQSMIMMDKIQDFIYNIPKPVRREALGKVQRTTIRFKNGSRIVALPNSPNLLRGYSAAEVLCDEAAFFRDDELMFFNVLYPMLQTTDGSLITSSTPWGKNTVFYKFSQNPDFSKHHITWEDVVKAKLAKPEFIEEMRRSMPTDRFRREFEAEFTEDETAFLSQDLITRCINPDASFIPDSFFGF
ncbi:MAG: terminase family protein [Candidatus Bathyarchaeia archaeon]